MGPDSPAAGSTTLVHVEKKSKPSAQTVLHELSTIPLMRGLPPEEMHALVPHVEVLEVAAGTTLLQAGSEDHSLYLVFEGELDVVSPGGETLRTMGDGEAFGDVALITNASRDTAVRARTTAELLRLPKDDFDRMVATSPKLARAVKDLADQHSHGFADAPIQEHDAEAARAWKSIALRAHHARFTGLRTWHYIAILGGLLWLALWGNEQTGLFPETQFETAILIVQLICGLLLIDAASEALILATDRTGARLNWDGFTSGTIGSLVETAPEFFVIGFLVVVSPFAAFLTSAVTLFNNAIYFSIYSFFLPKDKKGSFVMPLSLAKAGSEVLIAGSGIALIVGIVMIGARMEGKKSYLNGVDLIVMSVVFIAIYAYYQYVAVKYYAEGYDGEEGGHAPDPGALGHSTTWMSIIVPAVIGLVASYFGGEAIGSFADTAINKLNLPTVPTAAALAFFAGLSELVVVAQAHRRGEIGIALSNVYGGLTQVQTLLLPFAMLIIGVVALTTGQVDLYNVPINIQTTMLMILQFPMLYVLLAYIQEDHTMNNLDAAAMTGIYLLLLYFLFSF
jgi:Ca2+/Na+ antiporter